jgi:hypothetical protein
VSIPCAACAQPVHAHAVTCPHCGGRTGVTPAPRLTAAERAAQAELALVDAAAHATTPPLLDHALAPVDPELALVGALVDFAADAAVAVVKAAAEAVADAPGLPRAYARIRPAAPLAPVESRAPDPPPPPAEAPRYLK